eukprot:GEMP01077870.1.p1 GENE.GEMP01077870.1~~GEMP01077870.1.p1  ORF type:complete len:197 (+),score=44.58 GEMP01077870.1:105-695(+)
MCSGMQNWHNFWQQRVQKERRAMVHHLKSNIDSTNLPANVAPGTPVPRTAFPCTMPPWVTPQGRSDKNDAVLSRAGSATIRSQRPASKMSHQSIQFYDEGRPNTGASFTTVASTALKAEVEQIVNEQMEKMLGSLRSQLSDEVKRREHAEATLIALRGNLEARAYEAKGVNGVRKKRRSSKAECENKKIAQMLGQN